MTFAGNARLKVAKQKEKLVSKTVFLIQQEFWATFTDSKQKIVIKITIVTSFKFFSNQMQIKLAKTNIKQSVNIKKQLSTSFDHFAFKIRDNIVDSF